MKQITVFQQKKVLVLGMAMSGYHAAKLLLKLGASVIVNDKNEKQDNDKVMMLKQLGATVILGYHPEELLQDNIDYIVKNPGIPYRISIIKEAIQKNIPIITDVELAYLVSQAPIISITGSNGKTTTTTLIHRMLNSQNTIEQAVLAGNIGVPATLVAENVNKDNCIVMEMSSFQLMGIEQFRPEIAVFVNIYDAHLDYHGNRENYVNAKLNLLKNQKQEDIAIFNGDIEESYEFAKRAKGKVYYFSKYNESCDTFVKDGDIYILNERVAHLSDINILGEHNLENVVAAMLVAKLKGCSNGNIINALRTFDGVKHRSQFVKNVNGRLFYNDSKATNILATQMALKGFDEPVILIAGGLDRGNGFEQLEGALKNVKTIVLYGETKYKLEQSAKRANVETIIIVNDLKEAVLKAYQNSVDKDVILFSPACASWDQFANFEVRGDCFIKYVMDLK